MGDGIICLTCGYESYDCWSSAEQQSAREVKAPEDWPAIERARNLPGGVYTRIGVKHYGRKSSS